MDISEKEELQGMDYYEGNLSKIMLHSDYSPHAMRVVERVMRMTSAQLEELNVTGEN